MKELQRRLDTFQLPPGREVEAVAKAKTEEFRKNNAYVTFMEAKEGFQMLKSNLFMHSPAFIAPAIRLVLQSPRVAEQYMLFPERYDDSMLIKI